MDQKWTERQIERSPAFGKMDLAPFNIQATIFTYLVLVYNNHTWWVSMDIREGCLCHHPSTHGSLNFYKPPVSIPLRYSIDRDSSVYIRTF